MIPSTINSSTSEEEISFITFTSTKKKQLFFPPNETIYDTAQIINDVHQAIVFFDLFHQNAMILF